MFEHIILTDSAAAAIRRMDPVVVMESTVWVHGLPVERAMSAMEECIRIVEEEGALPLITVLAGGKIIVGADTRTIAAMLESGTSRKVNIRDIPSVIQKRQNGATTVSATIYIASMLGLPVVVTGGIGGVHRMAETTFDVSADIYALSRFPIVLVSSGAKSVLNIGATLEKLESLGVPVIGYATDKFPNFYCHSSPYPIPERQDSVEAIAETYRIHKSLGNKQALLVANPVPESDGLPEQFVEEATERAIAEVQEQNVQGKDVTPHLLGKIHTLSKGQTVKANISLLKENSRLAAKISRFIYY